MSPTAAAPTGVVDRAKAFLELLLGAATLIYALGYGAWAVYAWEYKLGVPPSLESQYFVAGSVPAFLIWTAYLALRAMNALRERLNRKPSDREVQLATWLARIGGVLLLGGVLLPDSAADWRLGLLIAGAAITVGATFFSQADIDRVFARRATWGFSFVTLVASFILFLLYATRVFPHLPVEFGGPKPQCVSVDVDTKAISAATALAAGIRGPFDFTVVRSDPLLLLAQGDFYLFAQPDTVIRGRAFRVRGSAIAGVFRESGCVTP